MSDVIRSAVGCRPVLKAEGRKAIAVLTYPTADLSGDVVQPDGGEWSRFRANPVVDFHHEVPIGRGSVELKSIPGPDGKTFVGPVGTTSFFKAESDTAGLKLLGRSDIGVPHQDKVYSAAECVHSAGQAWRLMLEGVADGVSIEFDRVPGGDHPIGKSLLERRDARHYAKWAGRRYCHTKQPVNPDAGVLIDGVIGKAIRMAETGKFSDGEVICAPILKALRPLLDLPRKPLVRSGFVSTPVLKADEFDQPDVADNKPVGSDPAGDPDAAMEDNTPPTAKAGYDLAQGCSDLAAMVRDVLKKSEHLKGKQKLLKLADELEGVAEDAGAVGDAVMADVGGEDSAEEPEPEPDADSPATKAIDFDNLAATPLTRDDDGLIVLKSGYSPRRFKLADLAPVPELKAAGEDPDEAAALSAEIDAVRRETRSVARQTKYHARAARVNANR